MNNATKKKVYWHWVAVRAVLVLVPFLLMQVGRVGEFMFAWLDDNIPLSVRKIPVDTSNK